MVNSQTCPCPSNVWESSADLQIAGHYGAGIWAHVVSLSWKARSKTRLGANLRTQRVRCVRFRRAEQRNLRVPGRSVRCRQGRTGATAGNAGSHPGWSNESVWRNWGIGARVDEFFSDARYPRHIAQLHASMTPVFSDGGGGRFGFETKATALTSLLEKTGPAVLVVHSAACKAGSTPARVTASLVKGVGGRAEVVWLPDVASGGGRARQRSPAHAGEQQRCRRTPDHGVPSALSQRGCFAGEGPSMANPVISATRLWKRRLRSELIFQLTGTD
jgi:hypothetical protein